MEGDRAWNPAQGGCGGVSNSPAPSGSPEGPSSPDSSGILSEPLLSGIPVFVCMAGMPGTLTAPKTSAAVP